MSNKLWEIYDHTAFGMWYCGHHHIDTQYGKVRLLYDDIERIDNLKSYRTVPASTAGTFAVSSAKGRELSL